MTHLLQYKLSPKAWKKLHTYLLRTSASEADVRDRLNVLSILGSVYPDGQIYRAIEAKCGLLRIGGDGLADFLVREMLECTEKVERPMAEGLAALRTVAMEVARAAQALQRQTSPDALLRYPIPEDLSDRGVVALSVITEVLLEQEAGGTGGCTPFYSPVAWSARGEVHGRGARLIVCHDGGCLAPYFNIDYGANGLYNRMCSALKEKGLYAQPCTSWYTAIYEIHTA